jgi:hypothetical protein
VPRARGQQQKPSGALAAALQLPPVVQSMDLLDTPGHSGVWHYLRYLVFRNAVVKADAGGRAAMLSGICSSLCAAIGRGILNTCFKKA